MKNSFFSYSGKALSTLSYFLWPIVMLSLLDASKAVFSSENTFLLIGRAALAALISIYVTAFTYGFLVDLASGQECVQTRRSFSNNLRTFFWPACLLFLLPYCFHFILYFVLFASIGETPFYLVQTAFQPALILVWLNIVFRSKYPDRTKQEDFSFDLADWTALCIFGLVYYALAGGYFFLFFTENSQKTFFFSGCLTFSLTFWIFLVFAYRMIDRFGLKKKNAPKTIYLINPPVNDPVIARFSCLLLQRYPLVFIVLKALTPKGYSFKEFNHILWREDYYEPGALVAITCFTNNCFEAYKIAKGFREKGSKVIMGGAHATAFPEEALEFCDAVVTGPVEGVWEKVLCDYENNCMKGIYAAPPVEENHKKTIDYLLTQPPRIIADCLMITRGCKFNCYFCGGGHSKTGYYKNDIETAIALIKKAREYKRSIFFLDDNIYSDPAYAKELFKRMIPLNIKWYASSCLDIAKDPEAMALCKASGCSFLLIGYEIFPGSKEMERGGKFSFAENYLELSKNIKKAGIKIKAQFIYGFESDDATTFWKLWWFAFRLSPSFSALSLMTPMPNSRFYKDIDAKDRFTNLNWSKYDCLHLVFRHSKINGSIFRNNFFVIFAFFLITTSRWISKIALLSCLTMLVILLRLPIR